MPTLIFKKVASLTLAGAALALLQLAAVPKAYAHHPIISASVNCKNNGTAIISYTVTSWDPGSTLGPPGDGDNPEIDVLFNGVPVDSGAFLPKTKPPDQFTGSSPVPQATDTVDVQAVAVGVWGDGYGPGDVSNIVTISIPTSCAPGIGRFTGGGVAEVIADSVTVTEGFEVDCDLHQPSNNLEINWTGGNHFHMENFLAAVCTFVNKPNPPTAPVNTIVAKGTGRYDDIEGYTVEFELVDRGEPGTNDSAMFKVYETANPANVVLNSPLQLISSGNIQAHIDQQ